MKERIRGDRRAKGRFEVVGTLPGTLETWQKHPVRNVGGGGALVESAMPLPTGSRLNGRLSFQGHTRDVKAEVRHVSADTKGSRDRHFLIGIEWADGAHPIDDLLPLGPPPARGLPDEVERRRSARTQAADGTELNRPAWSTVKVLDISVSGVLFLAPDWMAAGDKAQLRMRLGDSSFAADIEVRRSDRHPTPAGGYRVGAAFTSLGDGSRASLEEFIGLAGR